MRKVSITMFFFLSFVESFRINPFTYHNVLQDGNETPPVPAPRPGDSPTPALPPKNQAAPPKRPPPPRRPPPPKAAPAMAEPVRPPPPKLSPDDDPFGEENAFKATTNGGDSAAAAGFADFGAFDEVNLHIILFYESQFTLMTNNHSFFKRLSVKRCHFCIIFMNVQAVRNVFAFILESIDN